MGDREAQEAVRASTEGPHCSRLMIDAHACLDCPLDPRKDRNAPPESYESCEPYFPRYAELLDAVEIGWRWSMREIRAADLWALTAARRAIEARSRRESKPKVSEPTSLT